jgi:hypothetical protein
MLVAERLMNWLGRGKVIESSDLANYEICLMLKQYEIHRAMLIADELLYWPVPLLKQQ